MTVHRIVYLLQKDLSRMIGRYIIVFVYLIQDSGSGDQNFGVVSGYFNNKEFSGFTGMAGFQSVRIPV